MSVRVVIPVKAPGAAKLRLAEVLDAGQRASLVAAMCAHVAGVAKAARGIDEVILLGPHDYPGSDGVPLPRLDEPGAGLNAALALALERALAEGVSRLVILPGDLPLLSTRDVELLVAVDAPDRSTAREIRIAPDRHGIGTNALSLPLPEAAAFRFAFGEDSCAAHRAEAAHLGLALGEVLSSGLERDIDVPADLPDAAKLTGETSNGHG